MLGGVWSPKVHAKTRAPSHPLMANVEEKSTEVPVIPLVGTVATQSTVQVPPTVTVIATLAVAMEAGILKFGDAAGVLTIGASVVAVMLLTSLISSPQVLSIVIAPLALVLMTIVQASLYPMYVAVFSDGAPATA